MSKLLATIGHSGAYTDSALRVLALPLSIVAGLLLVDGFLESSLPSVAIGVIALVAAKAFSQTPLPSDD
ncbi:MULTISPECIES: hypothetical protein [unclassified Pseudomonas]|uniref:hypothetical protein n=1 Tax=unclassified Pseudomonas TaxID=196821 RepID=UPI002AC8DD02|nr:MULTISPECIES: hypothetical protein [unclassified Pseudomonas]MEB0043511.1 hypothetical protein [Pseudomonas sp. MH10]MEB0078987.1 hypothetical protein [Pseudomonas sp. MH10out]MEB0094261.1 hypothetical protein [Pseudomonas sp. CCI4.2]MEB0103347.1 hypothetical protein [Pseudomonas sp. CCI3.2]MEB0123805.1 hypothetical protein [Pseudomonas sp. CCI1.2]